MIVDDSTDLRAILRLALERTGVLEVVAEASDGASAIGIAAECRPDVILLDLALPIMDGVQALPALLGVAPAAKVVVLSGFEARYLAPVMLEAGAAGYIEKGVGLDGLLHEVMSVIDQLVHG